MKISLFIDGDWIVYAAGFAGQKTEYCSPGISDVFPTLTELAVYVTGNPDARPKDLPEDFPVFSRIVPDPIDHVLHSAKLMLNKAADRVEKKWGMEVSSLILLDGPGNFREKVATIKPYKGNRTTPRPVYYQEIREYLMTKHGASLVYDEETDDRLAQLATSSLRRGGRPVICCVDKDLLQVPGWHFNPNKGFKKISPEEGELRLYRQAATGDTVDNIGGAYKVGPAKAKEAITERMSEAEKWTVLVSLYRESINKHGPEPYGGLSAEEAALENMRLVYLKREPREGLWLPPGVR